MVVWQLNENTRVYRCITAPIIGAVYFLKNNSKNTHLKVEKHLIRGAQYGINKITENVRR